MRGEREARARETPRLEDDEALVARVLGGDPQAFDRLYERYFPRVYRFLEKRLRNRADTEETVQEVFASLFCSLESYRGEAAFSAWVFGLTRRTLASRFKRKRAETVPLPEPDGEALPAPPGLQAGVSVSPDPLEAYECSERLSRLGAAAREDLTGEQWRLFHLHHLENRSIQEIARRVAKSEDAVKSHLYRARKALLAR